jgi:hypothetical protein
MPQSIIVSKRQVCLASTRSRHPSIGMATARLGHADLLPRDHNVPWRAIDLTDSRRYRAMPSGTNVQLGNTPLRCDP